MVNPGAVIGEHCIVNTGSIVEHDNQIENYVHISVGAKLAGTVTIGENTWVGIGAVVINNLTVCGDCMIGAGAVVVRNITESGTYVGVPARKMSESFRRGDSCVKSNMVSTSARTWYTTYSLAIDRWIRCPSSVSNSAI